MTVNETATQDCGIRSLVLNTDVLPVRALADSVIDGNEREHSDLDDVHVSQAWLAPSCPTEQQAQAHQCDAILALS